MDKMTAEIIGKKAKALKHCDKLLNKIDKYGEAKVLLNCTGVEFLVHKGDAIYLSLQKTKYALLCDIQSYEITVRETKQSPIFQPGVAVAEKPSIVRVKREPEKA